LKKEEGEENEKRESLSWHLHTGFWFTRDGCVEHRV